MPMSPEDEKKYLELRDNVKFADTAEEVLYHKTIFNDFKQELKEKGHLTLTDLFTDEEKKQYDELYEELTYATSRGEVLYYTNEIEKLFDQVSAREEVRLAKDENSATEEIRLTKDENSTTETYAY
ncbi:hypothetical protein [Priestia koreensis]|uniref:Uncharacterized protein n=1 Tax=Priestia koreensis TaxID=284581 RepID=A0A0M0KNW7_9BACI|nr:hypothetical protein [Priestia koreensis]KOO40317.1 hypothetical protein AMD01_21445 [Priestia koreensis]UNL87550.1 hypothetical protein IE339_23895 [Priestia koreensis]